MLSDAGYMHAFFSYYTFIISMDVSSVGEEFNYSWLSATFVLMTLDVGLLYIIYVLLHSSIT